MHIVVRTIGRERVSLIPGPPVPPVYRRGVRIIWNECWLIEVDGLDRDGELSETLQHPKL